MTDERQPHRCIAAGACRAARDGQPALTIDDGVLCDACRTNFEQCVKRLPSDYHMLGAALGEHQSASGDFVRSSPTPAMPISAAAEAVMADIAEILDIAATMVAEQLDIDTPTARRNTAPKAPVPDENGKLKYIPPERNSVADHAETLTVTVDRIQTIDACVRLVEPHIDLLAQAPATEVYLWTTPRRCDTHTEQVQAAEAALAQALNMPGADTATPKAISTHLRAAFRKRSRKGGLPFTEKQAAALDPLQRAHRAAANCDTCNAWDTDPQYGQARDLQPLSGLDVLHRIRNTHHRARAHLGHTRLRHHYDMPCPAYTRDGNYCGAPTVGRDDGTEWVNCTTCGTQWTEREYDWLKTLIAGDKEIDMLRWLLAEAYWRLDQLQHGVEVAKADPAIDAPGAGRYLLEGIERILEAGHGHQTPDQRKTTA
jgi:hypothetical protein